ncbi:hypothetical protein LR68_00900 [Anoxybacillus sp. BCO1]|nr:hypothetical protein LR68_00900 [Anoxybacillus sp. BCO1]
MNVQQIKLLLELQALQHLQGKKEAPTTSFHDLFRELLTAETDGETETIRPSLPMMTSAETKAPTYEEKSLQNRRFINGLTRRQQNTMSIRISFMRSFAMNQTFIHKQKAGWCDGLMQLMPSTARMLGVNDAFDPQQNIEGARNIYANFLTVMTATLRLPLQHITQGRATSISTAAFRLFVKR